MAEACTPVVFNVIGIVGEVSENGDEYLIFTHKKFDIGINGNKIVDVNLTCQEKSLLKPDTKLSFSYEVRSITCDHCPIGVSMLRLTAVFLCAQFTHVYMFFISLPIASLNVLVAA